MRGASAAPGDRERVVHRRAAVRPAWLGCGEDVLEAQSDLPQVVERPLVPLLELTAFVAELLAPAAGLILEPERHLLGRLAQGSRLGLGSGGRAPRLLLGLPALLVRVGLDGHADVLCVLLSLVANALGALNDLLGLETGIRLDLLGCLLGRPQDRSNVLPQVRVRLGKRRGLGLDRSQAFGRNDRIVLLGLHDCHAAPTHEGASVTKSSTGCGLPAVGQNPPVPYLRLIEVDEATGELREEYDAAIGRAGKVFGIVKAMSLRPRVLRSAMGLYREVMFGRSDLTRAERELLAVVVSSANDCHY